MSQDLPFQDDELQRTPQDIRDDLAETGRRSLFYFAQAILQYRDMSDGCHGPLCEFLDRNKARFKLVLMPRGHFKTSVATISRVLQKVCNNPEERILLANETSTNAERFLSAIKSHVLTNRVFRTLYSDIIPKDTKKVRWNNQEMEFVRKGYYPEPTIDTIGMTGAMTSRHYTHITIDDPISEEAAKSENVMQDVITRVDKIVSLMVKPEVDTFDLIGTRWAFHDVYSHFMKSYGDKLARFIRGAIEDGHPIFPELISVDTLAQARGLMGEYMFSCLYLNNPRNASAQDFNVDDLRFWRWSQDGQSVVLVNRQNEIKDIWALDDLDITTTVDLAPAEKISDDRNAIVTCGVTPDGDAVILETWAKRCTPLEVIEHLFALKTRFPRLRALGIEGVAYQKAFKYFLKSEAERRGVYMNVIELKAIGRKEQRIKGLQPVVATGHLYIEPTMHLLRNEMSEFPLGRHDDVLDALAMQLQVWRGVMSAERWEKYKIAETKLMRRIKGYGVRGDSVDPDDVDFDTEQPAITDVILH